METYPRRRADAISYYHFERNGLNEMLAFFNSKFLDPDKDFTDESYEEIQKLIRFSYHIALYCQLPFPALYVLVEACVYYYINQPVHKKSNLKIFLLWLRDRFHYCYDLQFPFYRHIDSEQIDDIVNSFNRFL